MRHRKARHNVTELSGVNWLECALCVGYMRGPHLHSLALVASAAALRGGDRRGVQLLLCKAWKDTAARSCPCKVRVLHGYGNLLRRFRTSVVRTRHAQACCSEGESAACVLAAVKHVCMLTRCTMP